MHVSPSEIGINARKDALRQRIAALVDEYAAIEFEDRNQLMAGFTDNLPEAIRAFDSGREPVYLDEPRRDLFEQP
jgi:enoyl-CoA hydratase